MGLCSRYLGMAFVFLLSIMWALKFFLKNEGDIMGYSIHLNQLQGLLAEQNVDDENFEFRNISRALRFLEGVDDGEETLRLRRPQRSSESLFDKRNEPIRSNNSGSLV